MKNVIDKDYIRRKISRATGGDPGEVHPQLFLPGNAVLEVEEIQKKAVFHDTAGNVTGEMDSLAHNVSFTNGTDSLVTGRFSAS
jgi:hypothetical protein